MTQARRKHICLESTPYYHCIARCVRRAFLCGHDKFSGNNYEHRRQWVVDRINELSSVFCVDICAYAVMHNHYHVVLHVDRERARQLDARAVIERWQQLFSGPQLVQRYVAGEMLLPAERDCVDLWVQECRERLSSVSWFMRCLNEWLARKANEEDKCTGRFWEGRFKSQALLDETALLTCMAYVDLNPVRAGMATTPEASDYTSIQQRLLACVASTEQDKEKSQPVTLLPFSAMLRQTDETQPPSIPYPLRDYVELLEWTGRAVHPQKRGHIPEHLPGILERLQLDGTQWVEEVRRFSQPQRKAFGNAQRLQHYCQRLGQHWLKGMGQAVSQRGLA